MALIERVTTLIRANLNDLIDKAEDPEKVLKQVVLDMQNQLLQVKTQVALAMADRHLLEKKKMEHEAIATDWMRKAEMAVEKRHDELARPALERALSYRQMAVNFSQQLDDQQQQVETLKSALRKLEQKMVEAQAATELLIARQRRARIIARASDSKSVIENSPAAAHQRMKNRVLENEATAAAKAEMAEDSLDDRLALLGRSDEIDRILNEIKARKGLS